MRPTVTLRRALSDPGLLGTILDGPSWSAWRALLLGAMGEVLTADERAVFAKLTGREREPLQRVEEFLGVIGRRGGKSRAIATLVSYIAGLCDHSDVLAPGERGVLLCIAPDQRQSAIVLNYTTAALEASPVMRQLIAGRTADTLSLTTGVDVEVRAANFRRLRGPTYVAVISDEAAYFQADDSSANPDTEILNAVRPGLSTTNGPLITITSPYARRGEVWQTFKRHFGPNGDPLILVAQGASRDLNPSLSQRVVDRALARDPAAASAEYLAQFRTDVESFISREAVELCISPSVHERPRVSGVHYSAFVDPSGGSADSMTLAIGHREGDVAILDAVRERRPPFSPDDVTLEFATLLQAYGISTVTGDKYAGEWPRERFRVHGIKYDPAARPKSDLYRDILPAINSRKVDLLDNERVVNQFVGLERRTARGGKDQIDHAPGSHDDLCNSVAGVLASLTKRAGGYDTSMKWIGDISTASWQTWAERAAFGRTGWHR